LPLGIGYNQPVEGLAFCFPPATMSVTRILSAIEQGDSKVADQLLRLYQELRKLPSRRWLRKRAA